MNKLTLLSLVTATVLFTACGEDAKKAVTDAATSVTETVKETTTSAVEATKEATINAAKVAKEKAAEVAAAAKEEAEKIAAAAAEKAAFTAQALKDRAATATEIAKKKAASVVPTTAVSSDERPAVESEKKEIATENNAAGKTAYTKCAGCHGANGQTKALGKSAVLAGQSVADLETKIAEYKAGTRNVSGMGMLMKGQVASMDEATIKAVAEYISGL